MIEPAADAAGDNQSSAESGTDTELYEYLLYGDVFDFVDFVCTHNKISPII